MISIMLSDEVFGRVVQLIRGLHPLTHSLALDLREGFCNLCVHSDKHSKPLAPQSGVCGSLWQSLISAVLHASLMLFLSSSALAVSSRANYLFIDGHLTLCSPHLPPSPLLLTSHLLLPSCPFAQIDPNLEDILSVYYLPNYENRNKTDLLPSCPSSQTDINPASCAV